MFEFQVGPLNLTTDQQKIWILSPLLTNILYTLRIVTDGAGGAGCTKFKSAEAGSIWNKIYKNHMQGK